METNNTDQACAALAVPLGVLMLQTRFPRPPGDIGHPASFDFPVLYRVVQGASAARVVRERAADAPCTTR